MLLTHSAARLAAAAQVARHECLRVVLHGRSEFEAHDVTLAGDMLFEVGVGSEAAASVLLYIFSEHQASLQFFLKLQRVRATMAPVCFQKSHLHSAFMWLQPALIVYHSPFMLQVPDGHRMCVTAGPEGKPAVELLPLGAQPSWRWQYSLSEGSTSQAAAIVLELEESLA